MNSTLRKTAETGARAMSRRSRRSRRMRENTLRIAIEEKAKEFDLNIAEAAALANAVVTPSTHYGTGQEVERKALEIVAKRRDRKIPAKPKRESFDAEVAAAAKRGGYGKGVRFNFQGKVVVSPG